jgi:hypothetical protein
MMEISLTSEQLNNILMFTGKSVSELIESISVNGGPSIVNLGEEIITNYPIPLYSLLTESRVYKHYCKQTDNANNIDNLKKFELDIKLSDKVDDARYKDQLNKIDIDANTYKMLVLCIVNDVIPMVMIGFDIIKMRSARILKHVFGNQISINEIFAKLRHDENFLSIHIEDSKANVLTNKFLTFTISALAT